MNPLCWRVRLSAVASFVAVTLTLSAPVVGDGLNDGLVAYWSFDEGSGSTAYDYSGNGNDGVIHGPTWDTGVSGGALRFDGVDDYVGCGNDTTLDVVGAITLSAWIKPMGSSGSIVSKAQPCNSLANYNLMQSAAASRFGYWDGTGYDNYYVSAPTIPLGDWHHLVATYSYASFQIQLYVDGQPISGSWLDGNSPDSPSPVTTPNELALGALLVYYNAGACSGYDVGDPYFVFDGVLDEVRIYSRALSQSEIQYLHDCPGGLPGPPGDPLCDLFGYAPAYRGAFLAPAGYGRLTGADGDVSQSEWVVSTNDGLLLFYDGDNGFDSTPARVVDTGWPLVGGVAYTASGLVLGANTDLIEGHVDGTTWVQENLIGLVGVVGDVQDVDHAFGTHFVILENDGWGWVEAGGQFHPLSASLNGWEGIELVGLQGYDNHLLQGNGDVFHTVDATGNVLSAGFVVAGLAPGAVGIAHIGRGGSALQALVYGAVGNGEVRFFDPLPHHPWIVSVLDPCTPLPRMDENQDCDVDLADLDTFVDCSAGPGGGYPLPDCVIFDAGGNGAVDLKDFSHFQRCFSGDGNPADSACLD